MREGLEVTEAQHAKVLQELLKEMAELEVRLPSGYDPDVKSQGLVRSFGAAVGTATCVVIDRGGKVAWFLQDPRESWIALARGVIERLLQAPAKG